MDRVTPHEMTASVADGTLIIRRCTCTYTWGMDDLGHVTEVRRPGLACPTHPGESQ